MYCSSCGVEVEDDSVYCDSCGELLSDGRSPRDVSIRCPECGAEASGDAAYCDSCGRLLLPRPARPGGATGLSPAQAAGMAPTSSEQRTAERRAGLPGRGFGQSKRKTFFALAGACGTVGLVVGAVAHSAGVFSNSNSGRASLGDSNSPAGLAATPSPATPQPTATSPPATPTPTSAPPTSTPVPGIRLGIAVAVTNTIDCLNVRASPGTGERILICLPDGSTAQVIDGPVDAGGFRWWRIEGNSRGTAFAGWAAERSPEGTQWLTESR